MKTILTGKNAQKSFFGGRLAYTLVEVIISTFIVTLVAGSVVKTITIGRNLSYASNQRLAAFSLAKARFEEIKSTEYSDITTSRFPYETDLEFAHLAGTRQQPLYAWRYTEVFIRNNPTRKDIRVWVWWRGRNRWFTERIAGSIYPG